MRAKGAAFTLVEILVVIGIIAVLLAILMPAMVGARESANSSTCANNLRRLQIASMTYATDNENFLPPAHFYLITKNRHRWHGTRPSVGPPNNPTPFNFASSPLRYYLDTVKIKTCPNFDPPKAGFEASAGGYGYNAQYLGSSLALATGVLTPTQLESNYGNRPAKVSQIKHPADTVMFTDAAMANPIQIEYSFAEPPLLSGQPSSPSIHFRHRGLANVVWLDGHVSSEKMEWTYPTNTYGADNTQMKLGFFGPKDNSLFDRE